MKKVEDSFACFESTILPIFVNLPVFVDKRHILHGETFLYTLAETILLFDKIHKDSVEFYMDKYFNVVKTIDSVSLKLLLERFADKKEQFMSSTQIRKLFMIRHQLLTEMLKQIPEFSWSMPGKLSKYFFLKIWRLFYFR
jgi:hypothetical protein